LYFNDWFDFHGRKQRISQISVRGGEISYLETPSLNFPALAGGSSDGSQLLLIDLFSDKDGGFPWLASLPDGSLRRLGDMHVASAALVPGSTQFVYTQGTKLKQLFAADPGNGTSRLVLNAPREIYLFALSPDGQRIRFEMPGELWESSLNDGRIRRFLPEQKAPLCCGAWSLDGKIYAFTREDQGVWDLWAVRETDWLGRKRVSQPIQLTNGPISFSTPVFSREGDKIFALGIVQRGELSVYDNAPGRFSPYLGGISAGYVDFSRDGQWVAYVAYPQSTLWVSRVDGSERLQLTFPPIGPVLNPKWSPDGSLIAFTEFGMTEKKVYVVPAKGGNPLLLLAGTFNPSDPTWSPDGKSIAYSGVSLYVGTGTEVRILNLETRQSTTVAGSQHMYSARWSPDGRYLTAAADDGTKLFLYEFATRRWKELPSSDGLSGQSWSHDSRYLYATEGAKIYRYAVPDGRRELAADPAGVALTSPIFHGLGLWAFSLTPDDRVLVLRDRGTDELYELDLDYR